MAENTNVVDDTYPVHVEIVYPQRSSRLQALLALAFFPKLLLLIPHHLILMLLGALSLLVAAPVAFLLILITGKHPAIRQCRRHHKLQAAPLGHQPNKKIVHVVDHCLAGSAATFVKRL